MTVYLTVPGDKLAVWAALQRMWLGTLLRLCTRGVPSEKNPVLFLVDEAAHIGQMHALEDAVTLLRGSGIRIWLFLQSLEQLKKCFGDNAATILDNMGTQQYFGITSYDTAEILSKRMGETTLVIRTDSGNEGNSTPVGGDGKAGGSRSSGSGFNISEIARRLLRPEEILALPPTTALVFHKNSYVCDLRPHHLLHRPRLPPRRQRPHARAGPFRDGAGAAGAQPCRRGNGAGGAHAGSGAAAAPAAGGDEAGSSCLWHPPALPPAASRLGRRNRLFPATA